MLPPVADRPKPRSEAPAVRFQAASPPRLAGASTNQEADDSVGRAFLRPWRRGQVGPPASPVAAPAAGRLVRSAACLSAFPTGSLTGRWRNNRPGGHGHRRPVASPARQTFASAGRLTEGEGVPWAADRGKPLAGRQLARHVVGTTDARAVRLSIRLAGPSTERRTAGPVDRRSGADLVPRSDGKGAGRIGDQPCWRKGRRGARLLPSPPFQPSGGRPARGRGGPTCREKRFQPRQRTRRPPDGLSPEPGRRPTSAPTASLIGDAASRLPDDQRRRSLVGRAARRVPMQVDPRTVVSTDHLQTCSVDRFSGWKPIRRDPATAANRNLRLKSIYASALSARQVFNRKTVPGERPTA